MVDFITAFQEGLNAAEIADKNKREINSVFDELNRQLSEATDGKVKVVIRDNILEALSRSISLFTVNQPKKNQAIWALNPLFQSSSKELAIWNQDPNGYPCKISFGNKEHYCEDKSDLENTLAIMLQDPIVGETLSKLIRLSEAEES